MIYVVKETLYIHIYYIVEFVPLSQSVSVGDSVFSAPARSEAV